MTGLDDRTFAWTHRGIAEYLGNQWAETPHGPHCENTKSWPFCLSAAGLGLQLTDLTLGTRTHWVYDRWVEDAFKKKYMGFDRRGRLKWVALYYDPLLDRVHGDRRVLGLFPSIYVVPQNRALGELLYRNAVASVGWDKRWLPVLQPGPRPAPADARVPDGARVRRPHHGAPPRQEAREAGERALLRRRPAAATRTSTATSSATASATRAARRARSTC